MFTWWALLFLLNSRKMTLIGIYAILCLFDKIPQCQKAKKQETITSRVYSNKPWNSSLLANYFQGKNYKFKNFNWVHLLCLGNSNCLREIILIGKIKWNLFIYSKSMMNTRKPQGIINSVIFLFLNNNPHIQMIALYWWKNTFRPEAGTWPASISLLVEASAPLLLLLRLLYASYAVPNCVLNIFFPHFETQFRALKHSQPLSCSDAKTREKAAYYYWGTLCWMQSSTKVSGTS